MTASAGDQAGPGAYRRMMTRALKRCPGAQNRSEYTLGSGNPGSSSSLADRTATRHGGRTEVTITRPGRTAANEAPVAPSSVAAPGTDTTASPLTSGRSHWLEPGPAEGPGSLSGERDHRRRARPTDAALPRRAPAARGVPGAAPHIKRVPRHRRIVLRRTVQHHGHRRPRRLPRPRRLRRQRQRRTAGTCRGYRGQARSSPAALSISGTGSTLVQHMPPLPNRRV